MTGGIEFTTKDAFRRLRHVAGKSKTAICWQVWTNDVKLVIARHDEVLAQLDSTVKAFDNLVKKLGESEKERKLLEIRLVSANNLIDKMEKEKCATQ
ncbi:hypothetical protein D9M68_835800 [compost metagenome]